MWNKKTTLFIIFLSIASLIKAQNKIELTNLHDSLKENAYSVIRESEEEFRYLSDIKGELKSTKVITILDSKGKEDGNFVCSVDQFESLEKFRGAIYDANGNLIRRIKQSDLKSTEYYSGLASDQRTYYFECDAATYPFTVKYEWEIKFKNGLIELPPFIPQTTFNQSIEKAIYRFYAPENATFLYKAINMNLISEKKNDKKEGNYQEWTLSNIKAIENEPYSESISSFIPRLYIVPKNFTLENTRGDMSNWNTFGNWQLGLLKDRDILTDASKQKLVEITKNCKSDREKVKVIYDYLGQTTRYVSIQLGIGGLQPMQASEVAKTGFGDCKGLSNYMRAMLKEVGIPSVYTVISTDKARLIKDFASASQMNHVILQVPLKDETLWLECTNPELPFSFVHSLIAGHDALLVKETGGEVFRLPSYRDSLNTESNNAVITLNEDGSAVANVIRTSNLFQYESISNITKLSPTKQIDELREGIQLSQARVNNVSCKKNKSPMPSIKINYKVDCEQYGTKTGNRLFIPMNVFRRGPRKLANKKRIHPISISYGYLDSDTITIEMPKNYIVESLPKPTNVNQKFGNFSSSVSFKDNRLHIINQLFFHSGKYETQLYPEFVAFCKEVSNAYSNKIILKKKVE